MGTNVLRIATSAAIVAAAGFAFANQAAAQSGSLTTVEPSGYVVFPRIVSDPSDMFEEGRATNTVVQLTNTSPAPITVHCFFINATSRCSSGLNIAGSQAGECRDQSDCLGIGARCEPRWDPSNFTVTLTQNQPIGWVVGDGFNPEFDSPGNPNPPDGVIPPVTTDFFVGELKCMHVNNDTDAIPVNSNVLIGSASIYEAGESGSDVRAYNAIGVQTLLNNGSTQNNRTMCLGGNGVAGDECQSGEYARCPTRLVLGHFFDGAEVAPGAASETDLTLTPCSANIVDREPTALVVQYLVFNEFEQRMSASQHVRCTETHRLGAISNIFEVNVQGTLAGQTHIRAVSSAGEQGILGIAEERALGGAAYHLVATVENAADVVRYVFPTQ